MDRVKEIIKKMEYSVHNVNEIIQNKKKEGVKVVGVFPIYAPEELVHAAKMFPVGCWGGQVSISMASQYLPPFACPVMQGITELSLNGTYDLLDGAIISAPCDTLKCFTQNFKYTNPNVPIMYCIYPQNNKLEAGVTYLVNELKSIIKKLEEISGNKITNADIKESIDVYNDNRQALMEFSDIISKNPDCISSKDRYYVMKSRWFMDKEEHTEMVREINKALSEKTWEAKDKKRIILAGIMVEPAAVFDIFDELGFTIVADELANTTRQLRNPVPKGLDQVERLARQWQNIEGCSVVCDTFKQRADLVADLATANEADGVIYCQMKFCEPEEFDFPYVKEALLEKGIPVLNLEIDPLLSSVEQMRTRLQAFAEQIDARKLMGIS